MMDKLSELSMLGAMLSDAERKTEEVESLLKVAKEHERRLREDAIPLFMFELELKKIELNNGDKLSIKDDVYASIPEANKMAAFKWLDDNNFGGIIKAAVQLQFSKGEKERAKEIMDQLREDYGIEPTFSEGVHAQTLKAFLREQLTAGVEIPLDLFGARPVTVAKIVRGNRKA